MDPTTIITTILNYVIPLIPAKYAAAALVFGSLIQSLLSVAVFFWAKHPPKEGTKARTIYAIISAISLYSRHEAKADVSTSVPKVNA